MKTSATFGLLLLVSLSSADAARIDVGDAKLLPDGTGMLDVLISGDSAGELLNLVNLEVRITPAAGSTSTLEFVSPPTNAYAFDPAYVFFGNSFGPVHSVSSVAQPSDTLMMGDSTLDFSDVTVTISRLLTRLEVDHNFAIGVNPDLTVGHTFTIDFVPGANTIFVDQNLTPLAYQSHAGTVRVVPEPLAGLSFLEGGLCCILFCRQQGRGSFRDPTI